MAMTHPVQRLWRDASVGARHVLLNQFMIEEEYGKLLAQKPVLHLPTSVAHT
jgi:hypothetical protein